MHFALITVYPFSGFKGIVVKSQKRKQNEHRLMKSWLATDNSPEQPYFEVFLLHQHELPNGFAFPCMFNLEYFSRKLWVVLDTPCVWPAMNKLHGKCHLRNWSVMLRQDSSFVLPSRISVTFSATFECLFLMFWRSLFQFSLYFQKVWKVAADSCSLSGVSCEPSHSCVWILWARPKE